MQLIARQELTSAAASITFSSIPATFTDLVLLCSLRTTSGDNAWNDTFLRPNSATTNLSARALFGNGASASSFSVTDIRFYSNGGASTASTFANSSIYIPNYTSASAKSVSIDSVSEGNQTTHIQAILAGLWNQTTAISSLEIVSGAGNLAIGSSISLFGVLAGSDGIVAVS
jgi:hypothetical protein